MCVPSGIRVTPGINCPSVKGMFATEALNKQTDHWWGGQPVDELIGPKDVTQVPADITGWKRTLATEYMRSYSRGFTPPRPAPTQQVPTQEAPQVPTQQAPRSGAAATNADGAARRATGSSHAAATADGERRQRQGGNGNGNGRRG